MHRAPQTLTKPAAGVIATRPATAPVIIPSIVGCLLRNQSRIAHVSPAVAAAVCVMTKALAAKAPDEGALPALNPNQPNQSMQAPSTANGKLWGGEMCEG